MMLANIYESNGRLLLEHVPLRKLIAEKGQQKVGTGTRVKIDGTTRTVASVNSGTVLMVRLSPQRVVWQGEGMENMNSKHGCRQAPLFLCVTRTSNNI